MVHFNLDADALERQHDFGPDVLKVVHRGYGEISFFIPWLVTKVGVFLFSGVPDTGFRIDVVKAVIDALIKPDIVENKKLRLGAEVNRVSNARRLEILLGLLRNVARIARICLARDRIFHIADDVERGHFSERIEECGIWIRDEQHVTLLDLLKAANT